MFIHLCFNLKYLKITAKIPVISSVLREKFNFINILI